MSPGPGPLRVMVALAAALTLAGCGIVVGNRTSSGVAIKVTTAFGTTRLGSHALRRSPASGSILDLTRRFFSLRTTQHGRVVESIDGHGAAGAHEGPWAFYVNGIEATRGAAATPLSAGDRVWWDLHDRQAVAHVPAVVGSYPEPFLNGSGGKAYPTVIDCGNAASAACHEVTRSLDRAGVKVSFQGLGTGSGSDSLAVLVGTFTQLRGTLAAELLQGGPASSGVYARFVGAQGQALELLDAAGSVTRTFHSAVGLVAAVEQSGLNEPVWLVTGTDPAGVAAAAAAVTPAALDDHFAVAVLPGGRVLGLPLSPR